MCRNNFIFLLVYVIVSFVGGFYLGEIILNLLNYPSFGISFFIYFVSISITSLFLLPVLNHVVE